MEIKDQTMTTATDSEGNEYIAEMEATITETEADGTQTTAEITTTADPDDPTDIEGHMTVTEVAPDGTETVTEIVTNEHGSFIVEEESALEEMAEAILGVEIDDNLTPIEAGEADLSGESESEVFQTEPDLETGETADFTIGEEMFDESALPAENTDASLTEDAEMPFDAEPFDATYQSPEPLFAENPAGADTPFTPEYEIDPSETSEDEQAELAAQEASAEAAAEAQQAADEFIAEGDYAAAAEAREAAENAAWESGDNSMLGERDAQDLQFAAEKQEDAAFYEEQQAKHAQEGDYEAAKEDAINAGYATGDADFLAGGADHTGQAELEEYNMDNAVWHEEIADENAQNAVDAAEDGNFQAAEIYAASAAEEQTIADDFGDRGEHGSISADYDPSSEVETGGSYDADLAALDTGFDPNADAGFDATAGMDAGYDAGADLAVDTGFDSGIDTSVDTSFDSGLDDV